MNRKVVFGVIAAVVIGAGAAGYAAEGQTGGSKAQGMHDKPGMQGMMGMMQGCQGMMGGGMMGGGMASGMMPRLPAGNEKLQLQMWAEMMQKMGEIAGKYAGQVK